jgi:hypothetical protein
MKKIISLLYNMIGSILEYLMRPPLVNGVDNFTNSETTPKETTPKEITPKVNSTTFYDIFSKSNIIVLFWFLAIYYILYIILNLSQQSEYIPMGKFFDIVVFGILILYLLVTFLFLPMDSQGTILKDTGISYLNYLNDPYSIISLSIFIFVLYLILFFFSIPLDNQNNSIVISIIKSLSWITFAILIIVDFFKILLGIPILSFFTDLFNPPSPPPSTTEETSGPKEEVFHISNNTYSYDEAQAVCSSYGANLANYNQINDYYNQGGEFCGYGWSADQMALFPTQETTWKKLQSKGKKNVCGRPGINGGVFDPENKFGVNCFGVKPAPTAKELSCMNNEIPKTPEEIALEEKIKFFKDNPELTKVASFNNTQWSEWGKPNVSNCK